MGTSTDAYLYYGFDVPEDHELPWGDDADFEDFDDWILRDETLPPDPYDDFPLGDGLAWMTRERIQREWRDTNRTTVDAWWAARRSALERINVVAPDSHCSSDYPITFFAVMRVTAYPGRPVEIETLPEISVDDLARLHQIRDWLGLPDDTRIGWTLASWWG